MRYSGSTENQIIQFNDKNILCIQVITNQNISVWTRTWIFVKLTISLVQEYLFNRQGNFDLHALVVQLQVLQMNHLRQSASQHTTRVLSWHQTLTIAASTSWIGYICYIDNCDLQRSWGLYIYMWMLETTFSLPKINKVIVKEIQFFIYFLKKSLNANFSKSAFYFLVFLSFFCSKSYVHVYWLKKAFNQQIFFYVLFWKFIKLQTDSVAK